MSRSGRFNVSVREQRSRRPLVAAIATVAVPDTVIEIDEENVPKPINGHYILTAINTIAIIIVAIFLFLIVGFKSEDPVVVETKQNKHLFNLIPTDLMWVNISLGKDFNMQYYNICCKQNGKVMCNLASHITADAVLHVKIPHLTMIGATCNLFWTSL